MKGWEQICLHGTNQGKLGTVDSLSQPTAFIACSKFVKTFTVSTGEF